MLQRHMTLAAVLIMKHGVTMKERAAATILTAQTNRMTFIHQGSVCQRLSAAPVQRLLAGQHLAATSNHLRHTRMQSEVRGIREDALTQCCKTIRLHRRTHWLTRVDGRVSVPVDGVFVADHAQRWMTLLTTFIQRLPILLNHLLRFSSGDHSRTHQLLGVQTTHRRMCTDRLVHQRLRRRRLVSLVVTQPAIADQINDEILVELLSVTQRQPTGEQHRLRIITIDVQNRRLDHLGYVAAVNRRARIARLAGCEADLIVDNDVQRAARAIAARLRQLQRLHDHTLPRKGRVPVDQHRDHLVDGVFRQLAAAAILPRPHRPLDHRIDDLQMRGIEGQRDMHIAARRLQVRRKSFVVLHVAGAEDLVLTLELGEQFSRRLAKRVDQHIQPPAMSHADDHFLDTTATRLLDEIIEQRDQCLAAFQREALLSRITGMQITLQTLGSSQLPENGLLGLSIETLAHASELKLFMQPDALISVRHMRKLCPDTAAINVLIATQDLAQ